MNDAAPPGRPGPPGNPAGEGSKEAAGEAPASADSGGLAWSGRELTSTGFEGDLGDADAGLLAALDEPGDETVLMRAVAGARLLVPIVAVPRQAAGPDGDPGEHSEDSGQDSGEDSGEDPGQDSGGSSPEPMAGQPARASTDMAVVTLTGSDGQRAFPVFSSVAALSAWNAKARPSPVTGSRAAQRAVTERCEVMLIDCGSAHQLVLRPSMVWALAQQREWLPAHTDPLVAQALVRATAEEDDVVGCLGEGDPGEAGILRVVLSLRPGLDAAGVAALATRVGERIATDGEARARIDGLSFSIRHA